MARLDHIKFREYLKEVLIDIDLRLPNIDFQRKDTIARYFKEELGEVLYRCKEIRDIVFGDFINAHNLGDSIILSKDDAKDSLMRKYLSIFPNTLKEMHERYKEEADIEIENAREGRPSETLKKRYPHICQGFYDYAEIDYEVGQVPEQQDLF